MTESHAEVLVIGTGLAGGIAALSAADAGANVVCITQKDSATEWAQGGIVYRGDSDPSSLESDILSAGANINNPDTVKLVAEEGPAAVERWLMKRLGVSFDVGTDGNPDLALEAAHHSRRILHVKDFTGKAIWEQLQVEIAKHPRIKCEEGILVDLMVSDRHNVCAGAEYAASRVQGAYVFRPGSGEVSTVTASVTILATGGFSSLYLHSTGPKSSRGDGISAAHRAGARTLHMEFVQFHPTALYIPGEPRRLITEALRGAGAKLLNLRNKSFVDELAPRDVVARAIHEEMLREGGAHVWLDLRLITDLETKFPSILKLLRSKGFDPHSDLIPVVPAAHYTLGGVWTDLNGATSLPGLYAAGEVACTGLHGANRLASTSLLEAIVFGERSGQSAAKESAALLKSPKNFEPKPWEPQSNPFDPALLVQDWDFLRQTLWNYVGLVRSERRLKRAERILAELRTEVEWFYKRSRLTEELIGLRHGVLVATLMLYAALRRRESVGVHYLKREL